MVLTREWLEEQGISGDPDAFVSLIMRIVEEMPAPPRIQSRLTDAQAAVVRRGGLDPTPRNHGNENPYTLGRLTFADLLATGFSVAEAATLLGVSEARIRQRLTAERSLYGIKHGNVWSIPRFQFDAAGLVPGIDRVMRALSRDLHPVSIYRWVTLPSIDLVIDGVEQSPREWLRNGGSVEKVVHIAAAL